MDVFISGMQSKTNGDYQHDLPIYKREIIEIISRMYGDDLSQMEFIQKGTALLKDLVLDYPEFGKKFDAFLCRYESGWDTVGARIRNFVYSLY